MTIHNHALTTMYLPRIGDYVDVDARVTDFIAGSPYYSINGMRLNRVQDASWDFEIFNPRTGRPLRRLAAQASNREWLQVEREVRDFVVSGGSE